MFDPYIDSDSGDSVGSTGPADSYDLMKSHGGSQDKLDSDDQEPVVSFSVPPVRITTPPRDSPPRVFPSRHSPHPLGTQIQDQKMKPFKQQLGCS